MSSPAFASAASGPDGCVLELVGRPPTCVGWRWLREHDESEAGLDPTTGQRRLEPEDRAAAPAEVKIDGSHLLVTWADRRRTEHRAATLETAIADRRRLPEPPAAVPIIDGDGVEPWSSSPPAVPAPLDYAAVVADGDELVEGLTRMRRAGWVQLDGVPPGIDAVEAFASRIGYVRHTIFGGVWELAAGLTDHADSAYGTTSLGPHTDGTYSHDGPGLQLFACQSRQGEGGESILVDGLAAAEMFAARDPDGARVLASLDVPCRYIEPGISLRAERPVLRCDQAGRLVQLSFNAYDREPFLLADPEEWDRFADAYDGLGAVLADESRWLRLEWQPGRLLMFDNWRVLHGRGSFTGSRRFLGCYLNHEDLESAWRVHGISSVL